MKKNAIIYGFGNLLNDINCTGISAVLIDFFLIPKGSSKLLSTLLFKSANTECFEVVTSSSFPMVLSDSTEKAFLYRLSLLLR